MGCLLLPFLLLFQLVFYGAWWLLFLALVFGSARFLPKGFSTLTRLMVIGLVVWLDFKWIQEAMRQPGWDGAPDMDGVFSWVSCSASA